MVTIILVGRAKRDPPPNHLGLDFHIKYIYVRRTYVSNTRARVSDLR